MPLASTRVPARTLLCALLCVALLAALASPAAASASPISIEVELARLLNAERRHAGVAPLRIDVRLVTTARSWSHDMARRGQLSHDPNLAASAPAGAHTLGENVGRTSGTADAAQRLHARFMESANHRATMLNPRFTDLGIGIAFSSDGAWATQRFTAGAPAAVAPAVEATADLTQRQFGGGKASHAVIVRDDVYADALAAGPLAGRGGPLLLTPPGPVTHPAVRQALEQTLPRGRTVWLVGGTSAVSAGVERELQDAGWAVRRISGSHRVATAERVARHVAEAYGRPAEVVVATAADWPDAASGGAYGAASGSPVLLSHTDTVPQETAAAIRDLRPNRLVALGGTSALSNRVVSQLGAERISGQSRQGTSGTVAEQLWGYRDATPRRWIAVPAFGDDAWTWALAASPLAARSGAAVLLVGPELDGDLRSYLSGLGYSGSNRAELLTFGPVPGSGADEVRRLLGH